MPAGGRVGQGSGAGARTNTSRPCLPIAGSADGTRPARVRWSHGEAGELLRHGHRRVRVRHKRDTRFQDNNKPLLRPDGGPVTGGALELRLTGPAVLVLVLAGAVALLLRELAMRLGGG